MNKIPVACQIYSLRKDWPTHPLEILRFLKEMGYTGVELYGNYFSPAFTAALLREAGMICTGWHCAADDFEDGKFEETLEKALTVGARTLCVAWYGASDIAGWKAFAGKLNSISERLAPYGIRTGYHSHGSDFKSLEGRFPWDIIAENTDDSVILQLDFGNTLATGADPVAWLKKYPGRSMTVHCKPWSKAGGYNLCKGDDVPWKELVNFCRTEGGTEWFIVEYEEAEDLRSCIRKLHDTVMSFQ